jgi:maleamate amidohydrolase
MSDKSEAQEVYAKQGLGLRMGFGQKPAVVVIDMQNDFVDQDSPSTVGPMILEIISPLRQLLDTARSKGVPIFYTRGLVSPGRVEEGLWKLKFRTHRDGHCQLSGTRGAEITEELMPRDGDVVIIKRRPSAFFCTDLDIFLRGLGIDTLIITGTSTSGCVRATVTDAFSRDYRAMVVRECVADRHSYNAEANLFDMNSKYADVVSLEETLSYLNGLSKKSFSVASG